MPAYPTKLMRYLEGLSPAEAQTQMHLFDWALSLAQRHGLQSPRFWAMRQVLRGLNQAQIEQKVRSRLAKRRG